MPEPANPHQPLLKRAIASRADAALPPLLGSFRRHLRAANKRPATIDHYVSASRQFLAFGEAHGFPEIQHVTREHVELWLEALHETYRPHSVLNRYNGLAQWLKWLVEEGEITRNPLERVRPPAVEESPKDLAPPELVAAVLKALKRDGNRSGEPGFLARRDAAIVALFYDSGMRSSEVANIRVVDLDTNTGLLFIPHTKTRRTRRILLSADCMIAIDRYLRRRPDNGAEWLFLNRLGGHMRREAMYDLVRRRFADAGAEAVISPHDLRHTSASAAAELMSDSELMDYYGWQDAAMPRHYTAQVRASLANKAHQRASPLANLLRADNTKGRRPIS